MLLSEQKANFEIAESRLQAEKESLNQKVAQVQSSLETTQGQKAAMERDLGEKIKHLEGRLEKAVNDKDELYKSQMETIQENLSVLKD